MQMHFIIISLVLSLKDIKLPTQTFLVKIDIRCIISHSSCSLPPLFSHGLIWYGNGFILSSYTNYIDLGVFDPIFPWQQKYPFKCKLYCKVFRISGWKITPFSIFCFAVAEDVGVPWIWSASTSESKVLQENLRAQQPKTFSENSQFCIVNKKPWASVGESTRFASGWNVHPAKFPLGLILGIWIRGLKIQILPCKWIICHWPSISFTAVIGPHMGLADMQCKVPVTLSIVS